MKMTVAQILARYLKDFGTRHIFALSGHSLFDLTDAIYLEPGLQYVAAQVELGASYMACGYAKGTRRLGVCMGSCGAGATNMVTGLSLAYKESLPVLALTSDVSRKVSGKGSSSWHEIPQEEIFRPITKFSHTLKRADEILDVLGEAVRQATTGRKGPVYLGFPTDVQTELVEVPPPPWDHDRPTAHYDPDPELIQRAAEELLQAASPTIIAGGGVYWAECQSEVRELAELLSIPFGTSPSAKGVLSEEHPLSLGVLGFQAFPFANKACQESDVILAVGCTFSEGLTLGYGHRVIPERAKILQIDHDPLEIGKIYPVHAGIVGNAKPVMKALLTEVKKTARRSAPSERVQRIGQEKEGWKNELAKRGSTADGPITQWHVYHALKRTLKEDALIVGEGGTGELIHRFIASARVYHSGEFRAIGDGIGMAIGLKLALPERQVITASGDGSFMLEMQELATAMALKLPLVFVVVHNSAYGNMKRDQVRHYENRVIGTDLNLPDLCALAGSFGAHTARVEKPAELIPALQTALNAQKPALLDVICPIEGL
jgi:acetolactate synthase-1/2/3 large subunit